MRRAPAFFRCTSGAAAAEMALIVPLAVVMLFGFFEVGNYFYSEHQVVKGVRDGARYGARQSFTEINCSGGTASISNGVRDRVRSMTRTGTLTGGTSRVKGWVDANITVTVTCPTGTGSQTGIYNATTRAAQINVFADVAYDPIFNGFGIIGSTARLKARQQATVMGI